MIKVLTFSKMNGMSEMVCVESNSMQGFQELDAIKRLVHDCQTLDKTVELKVDNHSLIRYESEEWIIIVSL